MYIPYYVEQITHAFSKLCVTECCMEAIDSQAVEVDTETGIIRVGVVEVGTPNADGGHITYCILPDGVIFTSKTTDVLEAYERYTVEKKARLVEQVKKNKLQANLERISMMRVMRICLYIHVKNTRAIRNNNKSPKKNHTVKAVEVRDIVNRTHPGDIISKYFKLGMAAKVSVNNPAGILQLCIVEEQMNLLCGMICEGKISEEDAVYMDTASTL